MEAQRTATKQTVNILLVTYMCVLDSLQVLPLPLIVAKEVSILTGVDMLMNLQQEPLAEFKCLKRGFV